MTKKIFINIAAFSVITMCALGCDAATEEKTKNNDIPTDPIVELPPSVGENPFKGKTFEEGDRTRYVFSSDGKTIMYYTYHEGEKVNQKQYKCSVNAKEEEVAWYLEKKPFGSEQLSSFEECMAYIKSGEFWESYKAYLKSMLDEGYITVDEFDEDLKSEKECIDGEIAYIKDVFSQINRYKYVYNENKGTLDLYEQFEKSSASFEYDGYNQISLNELSLAYAYVYSLSLGNDAQIRLRKANHHYSTYFYSQSFSDNEIVFYREDDKNDTFTARYELTGNGNNTKMQLSFTYDGKEFNPTLDFVPHEIHLTEVK